MALPEIDISVLIVNWNSKHYLRLCLESVENAAARRSFEILVVDNASTDGPIEMIRARYSHVTLIESSENLGFSKGNNLGVRQAKGRYIALVNPDVIGLTGCLDALADFLDQNKQVGDVVPRALNPDGTTQSSCQRFPTLWNSLCSALGLATRFKNSRFFAGQDMYCLPVDVVVGCFSMIRRETFEDVALLDEELFMYADDVDWCRRAWSRRWQVIYYPHALVIHDRSSITVPYPVRFALERQ